MEFINGIRISYTDASFAIYAAKNKKITENLTKTIFYFNGSSILPQKYDLIEFTNKSGNQMIVLRGSLNRMTWDELKKLQKHLLAYLKNKVKENGSSKNIKTSK